MEQQPKIPKELPIEQVMKLASTAKGQAILTQLQNSHPQELEEAIADAKAGDFRQVQEKLTEFLHSPAGRELMKQLRG